MEHETGFRLSELKQTSELEQEEKYGRNVEIHAIFLRHGKKDESGELTDKGRRRATNFGGKLEGKKTIKGYSSPVKRAIETVERIIEKQRRTTKN